MPDRATMQADLVNAGRTGGEVRRAALDLGFKGRALSDLTDAEILRLYLQAFATPEGAESVPFTNTADDSPEGLAFNAALKF